MPEIAQTADHALRILEELGRGEPLGLTQLSERLGLNRTVVHRLLYTLGERGFVRRLGALYQPGAALIPLAAALEPGLRAVALPVMRRLADLIGETVVLHVIDGMDALVLEQAVGGRHIVQVRHHVGSRHPLHVAASGRAILAFLSEPARTKAVSRAGHSAVIATDIAAVRTARHAVSHDELQDGVHGVAVPLFDADNAVLGSLAVLVPTARAERLSTHIDPLHTAAEELQLLLRNAR